MTPDIVPTTMSDRDESRPPKQHGPSSLHGQSLVEFALVIPMLLVLLLGTIDFGRAYFGWVGITNAARVGANYAADHPAWTPADQAQYNILISGDAAPGAGRNCQMPSPAAPVFTRAGTPVTNPQLGDYATVTLTCNFDVLTPLAGRLIGQDPVALTATATFPVRNGCASCPPPPPAPTPQAPIYCREVPAMAGLSVAGARSAWTSAGFSLAKFTPPTGEDTRTVQSVAITEDDPTSNCSSWTPGSWAIFSSSAVATLEPIQPVDPTCTTVPNLVGMTIGMARVKWADAGFTGAFDPPDQDLAVVTSQATSPDSSTAGVSCIPPTNGIAVTPGPAWAAPPPAPCRVPNFSNKYKSQASSIWTGAGFQAAKLSFNGSGQNDWKIQRQSLVGGDYVDCGSSIILYRDP